MTCLNRLCDLRRAVPLIACLALLAPAAQSRPEMIRPGLKYYSSEYFEKGLVKDIGTEKNYEEVFQHYTYYEVIYDARGRPTVFKEYKQGTVILEERYRYLLDPPTVERTVLIPGSAPRVTRSRDPGSAP